ncbi:MAG: hypothetical protein QW303_06555 [Nitrososphaerota archaeon]
MNRTKIRYIVKNPIMEISRSTPVITKFIRDCNLGFFINTSLHTKETIYHDVRGNPFTALSVEKEIVFLLNFQRKSSKNVYYISWNEIASVEYGYLYLRETDRGASMSCIFENNAKISVILKKIDVAVIVTMEKLDEPYAEKIEQCMISKIPHLKALIYVFVGTCNDSGNPAKVEMHISKFKPTTIYDSCILFYDMKDTYVIWARGCFGSYWKYNDIKEDTTWDQMKKIDAKTVPMLEITFYDQYTMNSLYNNGYIHIGLGKFINPKVLICCNMNIDDFFSLPMDIICHYFCINGGLTELLEWLEKHRKKIIISSSESNMINHKFKEIEKMMKKIIISHLKNPKDILFRYLYEIIQTCTNNEGDKCYLDLIDKNYFIGFSNPESWYSLFTFLNPKYESEPFICTICFEDNNIPFILIRKKLDENFLSSIENHDFGKNVMSYFYIEPICLECTYKFSSGKKIDPMMQHFITSFPLIKVGSDPFMMCYYLYCFSELVDFTSGIKSLDLDEELVEMKISKVMITVIQKIISILKAFIVLFLDKHNIPSSDSTIERNKKILNEILGDIMNNIFQIDVLLERLK